MAVALLEVTLLTIQDTNSLNYGVVQLLSELPSDTWNNFQRVAEAAAKLAMFPNLPRLDSEEKVTKKPEKVAPYAVFRVEEESPAQEMVYAAQDAKIDKIIDNKVNGHKHKWNQLTLGKVLNAYTKVSNSHIKPSLSVVRWGKDPKKDLQDKTKSTDPLKPKNPREGAEEGRIVTDKKSSDYAKSLKLASDDSYETRLRKLKANRIKLARQKELFKRENMRSKADKDLEKKFNRERQKLRERLRGVENINEMKKQKERLKVKDSEVIDEQEEIKKTDGEKEIERDSRNEAVNKEREKLRKELRELNETKKQRKRRKEKDAEIIGERKETGRKDDEIEIDSDRISERGKIDTETIRQKNLQRERGRNIEKITNTLETQRKREKGVIERIDERKGNSLEEKTQKNDKEINRKSEREHEREEVTEQEMEEIERERKIDTEKQRAIDRRKERESEIEKERERLKKIEREREIELEKERERAIELELEKERGRTLQIELEKERERALQIELDKERERALQIEKARERERERQIERERRREIEREKERVRAKELELEKERERALEIELEKERERALQIEQATETERVRDIERERKREIELDDEREHKRKIEREIERERKREMERETERERKRESKQDKVGRRREKERERKREIVREKERERKRDIEREKERERKREIERERKQEIERKKEEIEREKERERKREIEKEKRESEREIERENKIKADIEREINSFKEKERKDKERKSKRKTNIVETVTGDDLLTSKEHHLLERREEEVLRKQNTKENKTLRKSISERDSYEVVKLPRKVNDIDEANNNNDIYVNQLAKQSNEVNILESSSNEANLRKDRRQKFKTRETTDTNTPLNKISEYSLSRETYIYSPKPYTKLNPDYYFDKNQRTKVYEIEILTTQTPNEYNSKSEEASFREVNIPEATNDILKIFDNENNNSNTDKNKNKKSSKSIEEISIKPRNNIPVSKEDKLRTIKSRNYNIESNTNKNLFITQTTEGFSTENPSHIDSNEDNLSSPKLRSNANNYKQIDDNVYKNKENNKRNLFRTTETRVYNSASKETYLDALEKRRYNTRKSNIDTNNNILTTQTYQNPAREKLSESDGDTTQNNNSKTVININSTYETNFPTAVIYQTGSIENYIHKLEKLVLNKENEMNYTNTDKSLLTTQTARTILRDDSNSDSNEVNLRARTTPGEMNDYNKNNSIIKDKRKIYITTTSKYLPHDESKSASMEAELRKIKADGKTRNNIKINRDDQKINKDKELFTAQATKTKIRADSRSISNEDDLKTVTTRINNEGIDDEVKKKYNTQNTERIKILFGDDSQSNSKEGDVILWKPQENNENTTRTKELSNQNTKIKKYMMVSSQHDSSEETAVSNVSKQKRKIDRNSFALKLHKKDVKTTPTHDSRSVSKELQTGTPKTRKSKTISSTTTKLAKTVPKRKYQGNTTPFTSNRKIKVTTASPSVKSIKPKTTPKVKRTYRYNDNDNNSIRPENTRGTNKFTEYMKEHDSYTQLLRMIH